MASQNYMPKRRSLAVMMILFLIMAGDWFCGPIVYAQSSSATLSGTVVDEKGDRIPNVELTLLNLSTALQRHAVTDDQGCYVVPLLPPGRYNLTAQHRGFTTVEIRNVVLNTNDQLSLRIKLKIGEIGETVTIIENPSRVQDSAAIGTVIDRQFVENLPLNGRSFQSLFSLTPGVVVTRATFSDQGQFSVNGQRANANYFTIDGVSANIGVSAGSSPGQSAGGSLPALTTLGTSNNLVSIDGLEEFRILASTYAPEFGRTPGGQISIITRSGGNNFRGSVFNYFRNDALDASDWFANSNRLSKAAIRQNDFGGVLGGPIVRDRAFFFASYEGLRLRQPQLAVTEVPSITSRQIAPESVRPFLNAFPVPNGPETHNGLAEFAASYSDPSTLNAISFRLDSFVGKRLALFGRFNRAVSTTTQRGSTIVPGFSVNAVVNPILAQSLNNLTHAEADTTTTTIGATYAFSPSLLNELRANWSRARGATSFALDDFGGATPLPSALLFPSSAPNSDSGFQFLIAGGTNTSLVVGKNVDNLQRQMNLVDNLTLIRDSHQLKFGFDYRRLTPVYNSLGYNQSVVYDGISAAPGIPGTVLSGFAKTVLVFAGAGPRFPVFNNFSAYAQDTWRLSSRMTLNYGLRWELNPPPSEASGNNPFTVEGIDNLSTIRLAPRGRPLWKTTYGNLAPRVGVVQQLSGTTGRELILRASVGLFFDLGNGQAAQGFGSVFPFVAAKRFTNVPFPLTPDQALAPPLSLDPPFGTVVAFDPNLKLPRTLQWNLVFDKWLSANQTVLFGYLGAVGNSLLREDVLLDPNPNFSIIRLTRNAASSRYHSVQIKYEKRLSRGIQAIASYSWSRSVDNASSDSLPRLRVTGGGLGGASGAGVVPGMEMAPSDFDVRHSLAAAITYGFPKPRSGFLGSAIFRDWSIDGIVRARTATPVNVVVKTDVFGDDLILELQRPDIIPGIPLYLDDPSVAGGRRLNRTAFSIPLERRQGTLGYNALRGFPFWQVDLSLRRQFDMGVKLQFRAEVFNLLNHPNFGNPVNTLSSNQFGQSIQMLGRSLGNGGINGGLSPLYQIGGSRSIQLALKVHF
ncbi:MAG TPA: TonB-dependent receptor [Pyrinomonadaceae bacterium]